MVGIARAVEHNAATLGHIGAVAAVQPELRRDHACPCDAQHAVSAVADARIDEHLPAKEFLHAGAEQFGRPRLDRADQRIAAPQGGFEIDIGNHVEQPDRAHFKPVHLAVQRAGVETLAYVPDDQRGRIDPVGPDFHIVGQQAAVGDGDVAIHFDIGQQPARNLVDARHAPRNGIDRNEEAVFPALRLAGDAHIFERRPVEGEPCRCRRIGHRRRGKGPVQQGFPPHIGAADIAADNRGTQQLDIQRQIVKRPLPQIHQTAGTQHGGGRAHAAFDIRNTLVEGGRQIDQGNGRQPAHDQAVRHHLGRGRFALGREGPVPRGQCNIRHLFRAHAGGQAAIPFLPASAPLQRGLHRHLAPHQSGNQTLGRGINFQIDIKAVVVRHGIQLECQSVALRRSCGRLDHRTPVGNPRLSVKGRDLFFAGNGLGKNNAVHPQPVDPDIEIGQQRIAPVGHDIERRHPRHIQFTRCQCIDINNTCQIGEGMPVEPDFGRPRKGTLGVAKLHIAQHRAAINRSVNLPDPDVQPVFKRNCGHLPRDESTA